MKLVVGQFNESFEPVMDGVANVTKNYAYWLNKNGCTSYVVTPTYPHFYDRQEFKVLRYLSIAVPKRKPYRYGIPKIDFSFNKKVNEIPFDIVHAHCPFSSGQVALKIAKNQGIPIVTTFHSKYYDDFKQALGSEQLAKLAMKKVMSFYKEVDFVWAVNKATGETLRSYGFKGNIEIVHNGTDFVPPDDINKFEKIAEERLKINSDEFMLLFVGQHIWQKNLKALVQSLYLLKNMGIKYRMFFVGTGYAANDLKQMVKELGLEDCVEFLGMMLDRDFLKALFARANLFLFPSVYDNAPIVVREAAAMGCPSLVIEKSNSAEEIVDGYNGFLCENNENAIAEKVKNIILNRAACEQVGKTAQVTVYKNWEKIIDEVKERYVDIVNTYKKIKVC